MAGAQSTGASRRAALAFCAAVLAGAALLGVWRPPPAEAHGLVTGFADPLFTSTDSATRSKWFGRARAAGAGIARINVHWSRTTGASPPANPTSPSSPGYDFSPVDAAVRSARSNHQRVMLTILDAPRWAEGKHRPGTSRAPAGSWKPSPKKLGQFAEAVARRYSGHFSGLPRVNYLQAWNEPNLSGYLTPQYKKKRQVSAGHYRAMLNAFYRGVNKGDRHTKVVTGGTAPYGDPPGGDRTRPLTFLRKLFCLHGRTRLAPGHCPSKPRLDILAHHPINTSGGPHHSAASPNDASTPDLRQVRSILRAAERTHHISPGGGHPLWATEFWWESNPPDRFFGVPLKKHALWIEEALHILWAQGASVAINLQIVDSKYDSHNAGATLQAGLYFHDGRAKPALRAFRFPFLTHRRSKRSVAAWGKAPGKGTIAIERRVRHGWRRVARVHVHRGQVFTKRFHLRGRAKLRAKLGHDHSLVWSQGG